MFLAGLLACLADPVPSRFHSGYADEISFGKTYSCGDSSRFSRDSLLSHMVDLIQPLAPKTFAKLVKLCCRNMIVFSNMDVPIKLLTLSLLKIMIIC